MKFDLVIGNPPYVDSSQANTPIYHQFVDMADKLSNRIVALVIPSGFALSDEKHGREVRASVVGKHTTKIKFLPEDFFPGATVKTLYYIKDQQASGKTTIASDNASYKTYLANQDYIWKTQTIKNILAKCGVLNSRKSWITFKKVEHPENSTSRPTVMQINRTNMVVETTNLRDEFVDCHKVITSFLPNSKHHLDVVWYVEPGHAVKQGYMVCCLPSSQEAKSLASFLKTSLCRWIHSQTKTSRTLRSPQLKFIPKVELNQIWDDQKIYDLFKLDTTEIDYIKSCL